MYVTVLDAPKAFDRVNHSKQFTKLIDRGCPSFIVRILYYRNSLSDDVGASLIFLPFQMLNRVESFLSSHLFDVYMDELSVNLNKLHIGCLYEGTAMTHMTYTDDLCIFSPSVSGLRKLTDCCAEYGNMFDITYSANKSYCMVIKPQDKKNIHPVITNHTTSHLET